MGINMLVLPPLVLMEDFGYNWHVYLDAIYAIFCQDFIASTPTIENKRFAMKRHPVIEGKEATFWHIISEGAIENERLPNLRRCERIRWPRPIIEAITTGHVKCWKNMRRKEERIVIALEDFSYVVVLADRGDYILLWIAYYVEQEHTRRKLKNEFTNYWREKG
ncbi:MAG: hypothetical protein ACRDIV_02055 [Ktedonobacteraceae bacterium]